MKSLGLYIHIPFCVRRCYYCDFNTYAGLEHLIPEYISALQKELALVSQSYAGEFRIASVYFGGGTPSLLEAKQIKRILNTVSSFFDFEESLQSTEISIEANPETLVQPGRLEDYKLIGINRLSLGVQAVQPQILRLLGRQHDFASVLDVYQRARQSGFENINMDLVFGIPGLSLRQWQDALQLLVDLRPEHISLYSLSIEQGTRFQHWIKRGLVLPPDDDLAAEQYEYARDILKGKNYEHYEISNWALGENQYQCKHNLIYWRSLPYLGVGAGAHGFVGSKRYANISELAGYIKCLARNEAGIRPLDWEVELTKKDLMKEYMLMGLRLLIDGVQEKEFMHRFGCSMMDEFASNIEELFSLGLLEWVDDGNRLRLSQKGHLLANQVFIRFV